MRNFKKIAAFAAATILAVSAMGLTSFAASESAPSITIEDAVAGHTYEAYQIFTGTLVSGKLTNIQWGEGVDSTAILAAFSNCTTAQDVADTVSAYADDSAEAKAFAKLVGENLGTATKSTSNFADGEYALTDLTAGYYFVKDSDTTLNGDDDSYTRYILQVLGEETVSPKSDKPTVVKKVLENASYTDDGGYGASYNDIADYCIGDAVPFKIIGTLPSNLDDYSAYYYKFTDTLGTQFYAPSASDVIVRIDGITASVGSNLRVSVEGNTISVSFEDIKDYNITKDSVVTIEYTAVLKDTAVIGLDGQENEVYLEYSNNPNEEYNPDTDDDTPDTPEDNGETPKDKVIVFTYELDINKYLDALPVNSGSKAADNTVGFMLKNGDLFASFDGNNILTGWVEDESDATEIFTVDGKVKFIGLDAGVYTLIETTYPEGYNQMSDLELTITATMLEDRQAWEGEMEAKDALLNLGLTGTGITGTADVDTGIVATDIVNKSGSILPSTGGMGTVMLYTVGAAIVLGSGTLLIAKKRMKKDEE